jgi:hypothetical protein
MLMTKRSHTNLHIVSPNLHSSCIYLEAVSGRLIAEKSRSETASDMTNIVVACDLNFGHRDNATTVNKLPEKKQQCQINFYGN